MADQQKARFINHALFNFDMDNIHPQTNNSPFPPETSSSTNSESPSPNNEIRRIATDVTHRGIAGILTSGQGVHPEAQIVAGVLYPTIEYALRNLVACFLRAESQNGAEEERSPINPLGHHITLSTPNDYGSTSNTSASSSRNSSPSILIDGSQEQQTTSHPGHQPLDIANLEDETSQSITSTNTTTSIESRNSPSSLDPQDLAFLNRFTDDPQGSEPIFQPGSVQQTTPPAHRLSDYWESARGTELIRMLGTQTVYNLIAGKATFAFVPHLALIHLGELITEAIFNKVKEDYEKLLAELPAHVRQQWPEATPRIQAFIVREIRSQLLQLHDITQVYFEATSTHPLEHHPYHFARLLGANGFANLLLDQSSFNSMGLLQAFYLAHRGVTIVWDYFAGNNNAHTPPNNVSNSNPR